MTAPQTDNDSRFPIPDSRSGERLPDQLGDVDYKDDFITQTSHSGEESVGAREDFSFGAGDREFLDIVDVIDEHAKRLFARRDYDDGRLLGGRILLRPCSVPAPSLLRPCSVPPPSLLRPSSVPPPSPITKMTRNV